MGRETWGCVVCMAEWGCGPAFLSGTGRVGTAVEEVGKCKMWVGRVKSGPLLPVAQEAGLEVAVERCATHCGFQEPERPWDALQSRGCCILALLS